MDMAMTGPLAQLLAQRWWTVLLRGVIAVVFGVIALVWPGAFVAGLFLVLAIFLLADGVVLLVDGIGNRNASGRGWSITFGVLTVLLGIAALAWPRETVAVAYAFLAAWALIGGIFAVTGAIGLRKEPGSAWGWTLAWGVLAVLFGLMLMVWPVTGFVALGFALAMFVGVFWLMAGVLLLIAGFRIRAAAGRKND